MSKSIWKVMWERYCSEAAAKAGISVAELKRRLKKGEVVLEIKATVTTK